MQSRREKFLPLSFLFLFLPSKNVWITYTILQFITRGQGDEHHKWCLDIRRSGCVMTHSRVQRESSLVSVMEWFGSESLSSGVELPRHSLWPRDELLPTLYILEVRPLSQSHTSQRHTSQRPDTSARLSSCLTLHPHISPPLPPSLGVFIWSRIQTGERRGKKCHPSLIDFITVE